MDMILLGKINGFYGVKGWVKLFSHTQPREQIITYNPLYIRPSRKHPKWTKDAEWQPVKLLGKRTQGSHVLAHFDNMDSKETAALFLGYDIAIPREKLPKLPDNEYYWQDLVGMTVLDNHDQLIGTIQRMLETGANDVMVVTPAPDGIVEKKEETVMIPFTVGHHVLSVDTQTREIRVDWDPNF